MLERGAIVIDQWPLETIVAVDWSVWKWVEPSFCVCVGERPWRVKGSRGSRCGQRKSAKAKAPAVAMLAQAMRNHGRFGDGLEDVLGEGEKS